jgi:hypothetical protein
MVGIVERTAGAARQRLSSVLMVAAPPTVDAALLDLSDRWPTRSLAEPPSGSDLQPVMGDAGFPLLGHTLDYIRFGPRFARRRYERFGPVSWMEAYGTRIVAVAGPLPPRSCWQTRIRPSPRMGGPSSSTGSFTAA